MQRDLAALIRLPRLFFHFRPPARFRDLHPAGQRLGRGRNRGRGPGRAPLHLGGDPGGQGRCAGLTRVPQPGQLRVGLRSSGLHCDSDRGHSHLDVVTAGTAAWIALALAVLIGLVGVVHWAIWDEQAPSALPRSGAPAPADSVTIPPAASESAPWTRVCPACSRENPEDARFCAACGQNLEAPPPRRRSTRRTPPPE